MNILFVCEEGRCRSKTAAAIFNGLHGISARYAGIHPRAEVALSPYLLEWADEIVCMERRQETYIRGAFSAYNDIHIQTLDIPDDYAYMSGDLIKMLVDSIPSLKSLWKEAQASKEKLKDNTDKTKAKKGWWPFHRREADG